MNLTEMIWAAINKAGEAALMQIIKWLGVEKIAKVGEFIQKIGKHMTIGIIVLAVLNVLLIIRMIKAIFKLRELKGEV